MRILLLCLILSSCASSIRDEDCSRDYFQVGEIDGGKGYQVEMFETYLKVCSWENPEEKRLQYYQGYQKGISNYCTPRFGTLIGESGRPFPSSCKEYPEFKKAYFEGKKKALK